MCDLCIIQGSCCFGLDKMNPQGSHTENTEQSPGSTSGEGVSGPEAWGIMKIGPIIIITNNPRMWGRPVCYVLSYISSHCTSREPSVGAGPVPQTETELRGEATCPSSQRSGRTSRPRQLLRAHAPPPRPGSLPSPPDRSLGPYASHQRGHQGTSSRAQRANFIQGSEGQPLGRENVEPASPTQQRGCPPPRVYEGGPADLETGGNSLVSPAHMPESLRALQGGQECAR